VPVPTSWQWFARYDADDWDITRPELKEAWQQGRKELFYP